MRTDVEDALAPSHESNPNDDDDDDDDVHVKIYDCFKDLPIQV